MTRIRKPTLVTAIVLVLAIVQAYREAWSLAAVLVIVAAQAYWMDLAGRSTE